MATHRRRLCTRLSGGAGRPPARRGRRAPPGLQLVTRVVSICLGLDGLAGRRGVGWVGHGGQAVGQGHGAGDNAFDGSRDAAGGHAHHARWVPAGRRRLVRLAGSLPWPQLRPRTARSCSQRPCLAGPQPGPNSSLGPLHPQVWCGPHGACTSRPGRPPPPARDPALPAVITKCTRPYPLTCRRPR